MLMHSMACHLFNVKLVSTSMLAMHHLHFKEHNSVNFLWKIRTKWRPILGVLIQMLIKYLFKKYFEYQAYV